MSYRNPNVERRIATLPMTQSQRDLALEWVNSGNALADLVLALMERFTPAPTLGHSH